MLFSSKQVKNLALIYIFNIFGMQFILATTTTATSQQSSSNFQYKKFIKLCGGDGEFEADDCLANCSTINECYRTTVYVNSSSQWQCKYEFRNDNLPPVNCTEMRITYGPQAQIWQTDLASLYVESDVVTTSEPFLPI